MRKRATILASRFPALIHLALSSDGPSRPERPMDDTLTGARLGLYGSPTGPRHIGWLQATYGTASLALMGVLAALVAKDRHGGGERIDVSMRDGVLASWGLGLWWQERTADQSRPEKGKKFRLVRVRLEMCECADGEYLYFHTAAPGRFWRLMQLLGLDTKVSPSKGALEMAEALTEAEADVIDTEIPLVLRTKPRDEWLSLFEQADICCEPCLRPGGLFADPQILHNDLVVEVEDPEVGRVLQVGPPVHMTASPGRVRAPRPLLGQHQHDAFTSEPPPDNARARGATGTKLPPLDGIRVLDFGQYIAGPLAARFLADLGADVIKVEPITGDVMRPVLNNWEFTNRGKRSVALDLKSEKSRDIISRLLPTVDVVLHNMRPAAVERLGIGLDHLRNLSPCLIYGALPGMGSTGPRAHHQSFAPAASATTGIYFDAGGEGNPPRRAGNEDYFNGALGAIAVMMSIVHRTRTGEGQYLESPLLNAATFLMSHTTLGVDGEFRSRLRLDSSQMRYGALDGMYRTLDDSSIAITLTDDNEFVRLAEVVGHEEWAANARFCNVAARAKHNTELEELLKNAFGTATADEWFKRLDDAAVPVEIVSYEPIVDGMFTKENALAEGQILEFQHPVHGRIREMGALIRFHNATFGIRGPGALLGQHSAEILKELDYSDEDIRQLDDENIVITTDRV